MARVPRLIQVFSVQCVMCGRAAGQVMDGIFVPNQRVHRPVAGKNGSRCGECGGNLYLEPDESVTPFMAETITTTCERSALGRTRLAARSMRSAPSSELPPNLKATTES